MKKRVVPEKSLPLGPSRCCGPGDAAPSSEADEEGHHKTEESHGLGQSESQDSVGEQLLLQAGVPGISDDEGTEDGSDTGSRSGNSDGGGSGSDELGGGVNVLVGGGGLESPGGNGGPLEAGGESHAAAGGDGQAGDGRHGVFSCRSESSNIS